MSGEAAYHVDDPDAIKQDSGQQQKNCGLPRILSTTWAEPDVLRVGPAWLFKPVAARIFTFAAAKVR
jgi:hypothetical protein